MNNKHSLGCYLRNIRTIKGYSLIDVEKLTDRKILNSYLSQIETGRIKKPNYDSLVILSNLYKINIDALTKKAGFPVTITIIEDNGNVAINSDFVDIIPSSWEELVKKYDTNKNNNKHNIFQTLDITDYEEEELISYLAFLRTK